MHHPRLRRDIRTERWRAENGKLYVMFPDVLLSGRDVGKYLSLPAAWWEVARACDGRSSPDEIAAPASARSGTAVGLDVVRATIRLLDVYDLLDTDRSRARLAEQRVRLGREAVRRTAPGAFPGEADELGRLLDGCMMSPLGPGRCAVGAGAAGGPPLAGAIVPHANLKVSGPCAAHAYAALADSPLPDLVVLVGYNHVYSANTVEVLLKDVESPLGRLRVARDFGEAVCSLAGGALSQDGLASYYEHSIDMQVPWLQYVAARRQREIPFLPIILSNVSCRVNAELAMGFRDDIARVCRAVREAARRLGRCVSVIASGDFAHAGPYYGGEPMTDERVRELVDSDARAIQLIVEGRADDFYATTVCTSYCCPGPIYFLLNAIEWREAALLKYYSTWDIGPHDPDINSFAAIVFR